jgi:hypothetical protein
LCSSIKVFPKTYFAKPSKKENVTLNNWDIKFYWKNLVNYRLIFAAWHGLTGTKVVKSKVLFFYFGKPNFRKKIDKHCLPRPDNFLSSWTIICKPLRLLYEFPGVWHFVQSKIRNIIHSFRNVSCLAEVLICVPNNLSQNNHSFFVSCQYITAIFRIYMLINAYFYWWNPLNQLYK